MGLGEYILLVGRCCQNDNTSTKTVRSSWVREVQGRINVYMG